MRHKYSGQVRRESCVCCGYPILDIDESSYEGLNFCQCPMPRIPNGTAAGKETCRKDKTAAVAQKYFVQMEYGSNRALIFYPWEINRPSHAIHVIEYAAYEKLKAECELERTERDEAIEMASKFEAECERLTEMVQSAVETSDIYQAENERLRAEIAKHSMQLMGVEMLKDPLLETQNIILTDLVAELRDSHQTAEDDFFNASQAAYKLEQELIAERAKCEELTKKGESLCIQNGNLLMNLSDYEAALQGVMKYLKASTDQPEAIHAVMIPQAQQLINAANEMLIRDDNIQMARKVLAKYSSSK